MIKHVLFDLDNTLYPESTRLEDYIFRRMIEFSADLLGVSFEDAKALRMESKDRYRLTLDWLMTEHGYTDIDVFYRFVHPENEIDYLKPIEGLRETLQSLSQRRWVFTNGPLEHAERVLEFLDIRDCFGDIFDIRFSGFKGKPEPESYAGVFRAIGALPEECILFDDNVYCIEGMIAARGTGVLVDEFDKHGETGLQRIRSILEVPGLLGNGG